MMRGCVPVVTCVECGARDAVRHGETGMLVHAGRDDDDEAVARGLAAAIAECVRAPGMLERMSVSARADAETRFSLEQHARTVDRLIEEAAVSAPRVWPANRPCAFTASNAAGGGSGSVPTHGAERLREALDGIAQSAHADGRPTTVMLHGGGRHTIELAGVLAATPIAIEGIIDDDPAKWGTTLLGWRVYSPKDAVARGVTDVVISSWMHADAVYARRGVFESHGVRVHHLYQN
jgi:hypothetical protein